MTFFVDANVFVYGATQGPHREACAEAILAISRGQAAGLTSTAALEEVWFLEWSKKAGAIGGLTERAYAMTAPLLPVGDAIFQRAFALDAPSLGPNDRLHVATCIENDIEAILSADAGFDSVEGLRRVDPLDRAAMAELLAG